MPEEQDETTVALFYRYERLGGERAAALAAEQRRLGAELGLGGRVLVAAEGINGTVQGAAGAVAAYEAAVEAVFPDGIDWKHSSAGGTPLFPDFAVKEVAELVGFSIRGGDPLDVRREVGHFDGAIDPGMHHAAQWPRFVEKNLEDLRGRKVLLYCTGGIRCEKASAYLCRKLRETSEEGPAPSVHQLEGGIHRYLEAFPDGGCFRGANFVFDRRAQMRPEAAGGLTVGRCSECSEPWDTHHGGRLCCVCRALVLVCDACDASSEHGEYYCGEHSELRGLYHHFVDRFGAEELERLAGELRRRLAAEVGTKRKNRRATLRKKAEQLEARLAELRAAGVGAEAAPPPRRCRACERPYAECPGECWGFWRREPQSAEAAQVPE